MLSVKYISFFTALFLYFTLKSHIKLLSKKEFKKKVPQKIFMTFLIILKYICGCGMLDF